MNLLYPFLKLFVGLDFGWSGNQATEIFRIYNFLWMNEPYLILVSSYLLPH